MLLPSIFGEDLFGDWPSFTRDFDKVGYTRQNANILRTDVKETDTSYELDIDVPGYKKEDITAEVKDGYLVVSASKSDEKEEKEDGKYIRRERYSGSMTRSYYVGEELTEEDISARFENGILSVSVPKMTPEKIEEKRRFVAIAG